MPPAEADKRFLENAKRLELYGVDLHTVRDAADTEIQIGICHAGIMLYDCKGVRLNRFSWPKVLRIVYRKSDFCLRIRSDEVCFSCDASSPRTNVPIPVYAFLASPPYSSRVARLTSNSASITRSSPNDFGRSPLRVIRSIGYLPF